MDSKDIKKSNFTLQKFTKIYSVCLSVLIGITGISFIAAVLHLYFTGGDTPYTRERVGTYLKTIIVPIILTAAAVLGAAVLSFAEGLAEKSRGNALDPTAARRALARIFDVKDSKEVLELRRQQKRIILATTLSSAFVLTLSLILSILLPKHAVEGLNDHVIAAVLIMTPATLIVISLIYSSSRLLVHSYAKELAVMREQIKADPSRKTAPCTREFLTRGRLLGIRGGILALGVLFIVLGISNGGMKDVFAKAVAICTECIGLG